MARGTHYIIAFCLVALITIGTISYIMTRESWQRAMQEAAENKRIADEAAAREADKAHKARINSEAVHDICKYQPDLTEADAKTLIIAIAKGEVRHVKISY